MAFLDQLGGLGNALVQNFQNNAATGAATAAQMQANADATVINAQTAQQQAIKAAETRKLILTYSGIVLLLALLIVGLISLRKK